MNKTVMLRWLSPLLFIGVLQGIADGIGTSNFVRSANTVNFHISGHTSSGREVVCFLVSLAPDHVYPSGGLSFSRTNLVNLVHASNNSFLHPRSSNLQHVSPTIHPLTKMMFW